MAFPVLDTPRTDFGASITQHPGDLDNFTTQNSIPSPSKENNGLLRQIRGMRPPEAATPRTRPPLSERRNPPGRAEFTPLLKSATRNRRMLIGDTPASHQQSDKLETPAGFRESFRSDVGELPVNSSMIEEETASSAGDMNVPYLPPSSSSVLTTPMPGLRGNNGVDGGNLATLREQEARLEQIDKENFGLKLKIHFLEEALRKSGKEFNEAALKENTELKVDKVQLQRELKQLRRHLVEAQRQLEEYRRQLAELMEKSKRSGGVDELLRQEIDQLRQLVADKDDEVKALQEQDAAAESKDADLQDLKDDISDLEHQLRQKDNDLEEKQEEIDRLKQADNQDEGHNTEVQGLKNDIADLEEQLRQRSSALDDKQAEVSRLQEQAQTDSVAEVAPLQGKVNELEAELKILHEEGDGALEEKDHQILELKEDVSDLQQDLRAKEMELEEIKEAVEELKLKAEGSSSPANLAKLEDQLVEKEEEIEQLKEELQQHQESLKHTKKDMEELAHRLEDTVPASELEEVQSLVQQKEQDLRTSRQELQITQQKLSDKDDQVVRLLEQARSTASSVEIDLRKEIEERKHRIEELSQQVEDLRDDVQSYEDALRQADADTERKLSEKDHQLELKDDEVQRLEEKVDSLESEHRQREDDAQGHQSELNRAHGDAHRARDEADLKLREQELLLAEKESELRRLREDLAESSRNQSFAAKDGQLQNHAYEIESLKREIHDATESARVDLAEKDAELKELQEELKHANRDSSFAAKNEELRDLVDEVDQLKRQLRDVEAQVEEEAETKEEEIRLMEDDHRDALNRLQRLVTDGQSRLKESEEARLSWERQRSMLESEKLRAEARVANLEFDIDQQHNRAVCHDDFQHNARTDAQRKLQEAQAQVSQLRREKQDAEDDLAITNDDLKAMQTDLMAAQGARDQAQQTVRDLRAQLADHQRQSQQVLQSKVDSYETEVAALDRELDDAQSKTRELAAKNESLTASITRLKGNLATAETDLATARARQSSPSATASAVERRDLHEMLRDAKLNAEDLTIQLKESDLRATTASKREADLRTQLERARAERKDAARQAGAAAEDLLALRDAHDQLADELDTLRRAQRIHPKQPTSTTTGPPSTTVSKDPSRQHVRELRGMARQIEYLAARLRREESFRASLAFGKRFTSRLLEAYSRLHALDLNLVRDMGVPVDDVVARTGRELLGRARVPRLLHHSASTPDPFAASGLPRGVDATPRSARASKTRDALGPAARHGRRDATSGLAETRPSLRAVGTMVLASVRMRRAAEAWAAVRTQHEGLVRKLAGVRRERERERVAKKV